MSTKMMAMSSFVMYLSLLFLDKNEGKFAQNHDCKEMEQFLANILGIKLMYWAG